VENSGQPWWFDFFIDFSMKTLLWTSLLAMQSNRSAEFSILHSPALIPKFPQSPSGSYLFSHLALRLGMIIGVQICRNRPQALTCFHTQYLSKREVDRVLKFLSRNRPQALTCFHTAAVFNAENLCLFKPQNTNLPHSEACLKILLHF